MKHIKLILKDFDWFFLVSGIMSSVLGSVMASESGQTWKLGTFLLGLLFFVGFYSLERVYYYLSISRINLFSTVNRADKLKSPEIISILFLLFAGLLYILFTLNISGALTQTGWLWLIILVLLIMVNTSRSMRVWNLPYRWFLDALIVSPVLVFFSSSLQGLEPGRILLFLCLPLLFLYLASTLCLQFESYASNMSKGTKSFLVVIGWEKGIVLHNVILLIAYLFLGVYFYLSGVWSIAWPAFFMLIISLGEVYLLQRVSEGMKPNWGLIRAVAVVQYLGIVYILLFAFLTH
ncbi:MAG: hypothetical protein WA116_03055 [Anaerolineaceae bacterium]